MPQENIKTIYMSNICHDSLKYWHICYFYSGKYEPKNIYEQVLGHFLVKLSRSPPFARIYQDISD